MSNYIEISGVQIPEEKILEAGYVKKVVIETPRTDVLKIMEK